MQISYDDYEKVVEQIKPVLGKIQNALDELPGDTPVDEILTALCYMSSIIIDTLSEDEQENEDFSIDEWYTIAVNSIVEKLNAPQTETEN